MVYDFKDAFNMELATDISVFDKQCGVAAVSVAVVVVVAAAAANNSILHAAATAAGAVANMNVFVKESFCSKMSFVVAPKKPPRTSGRSSTKGGGRTRTVNQSIQLKTIPRVTGAGGTEPTDDGGASC